MLITALEYLLVNLSTVEWTIEGYIGPQPKPIINRAIGMNTKLNLKVNSIIPINRIPSPIRIRFLSLILIDSNPLITLPKEIAI